MPSFRVVVGDVVADFEFGFGQAWEAATVEYLGFEAAPKRFGVRIIVAVAAPAHALPRGVPPPHCPLRLRAAPAASGRAWG
jgi:hypothetical protein